MRVVIRGGVALMLATSGGAHAATAPSCPSIDGVAAQDALIQDLGAEHRMDCAYVEAGDLPWPVGRLRLEWQTGGRPSGLSDLCSGLSESAGERLFHAPGKAALVWFRSHRALEDEEAWEAAAAALVRQPADAVVCPAAGTPHAASVTPYATSGTAATPSTPTEYTPPPSERLHPAGKRNLAVAKKLYQRAENYYFGRNGQKKDRAKAFALYVQTAQHGHADGQYSVAYMARFGQGVSVDLARALYWGKLAAQSGNGSAADMLGNMYYSGKGVPKSYEEAARWYLVGVRHKNASSMYSMGYLHEHEQGVAKDFTKAFNFYQQAALLNNASAMYELGDCYIRGIGTKKNPTMGRRYMVKAAAKGNKAAKAWLAKNPG